jgi:uncharacterized protein (DUF952 family)
MSIYHLISRQGLDAQSDSEFILDDANLAGGFIHCCTAEQLPGVIARYFLGDNSNLMVVELNPDALSEELLWEPATDSDGLFPHIYGPINRDAINGVHPYGAKLG